MSKDNVELKNKASVHDFIEYSFSAAVHKDFPKIIRMYSKMLDFLYQHGRYAGVAPVIASIEENKLLMEIQYDYYRRVYERKGKVK